MVVLVPLVFWDSNVLLHQLASTLHIRSSWWYINVGGCTAVISKICRVLSLTSGPMYVHTDSFARRCSTTLGRLLPQMGLGFVVYTFKQSPGFGSLWSALWLLQKAGECSIDTENYMVEQVVWYCIRKGWQLAQGTVSGK